MAIQIVAVGRSCEEMNGELPLLRPLSDVLVVLGLPRLVSRICVAGRGRREFTAEKFPLSVSYWLIRASE